MAAPAGCYLTQAGAEPDLDRIFCSRRVLLPGEQLTQWRIATAEEKARYEAAIEAEGQNPPPTKTAGK